LFIFGLVFFVFSMIKPESLNPLKPIKMIFFELNRRKFSNSLQIISLTLSIAISLIAFSASSNLINAWKTSLPETAPNNFAINITEAEIPDFLGFLKANEIKTEQIYPVTSARFFKKNPKQEDEIIDRTFNFTWMNNLPEGNKIVFSHQDDTNINTGFVNSDISVIESDGSNLKRLIKRPGIDSSPIFSGDKNKFAFISSGGKQESIGLRDVYIFNLKDNSIKKLSNTPNRDSNIISWSSDNKTLIITENVKTTSQLILLPVNGDNYISWSGEKYKEGVISSVVKSKKSDNIVLCYENLTSPVEVFITGINNLSFTRLSDINNYSYPELSKTEIISWKSFDGRDIEGILTYPKNYKKGVKYPIILQIHGGPAGVFSERFNGRPGIYMTEYFSEKGYVTIKPNPRGSTGYGKEFRYANYKDWGYGDYEDVVSGVDKVINMGIGDPDKQYVMGWSYGGYLTSFIVTKTNRFKAASMGAGLPNLISMVTTTDIQDYLVAHMGSEFWEDYDTYEKHSAIYQIKNTTTPTQIIHGANDLRVPFTQGQEFYRALDRLGVDTEMVVYPRTPHGPREPKFLMDVSERILTWFENYK